MKITRHSRAGSNNIGRKCAAIVSCLLLLSACDMITAPWKRGHLKEVGAMPVTCEFGKDCDEKWARALKWVKKKTVLPIAMRTDSIIKTGDSVSLSPDVAFTITKVPTGGTSYRIDYMASCDDEFGCVPPLLALKASFVEYVTGMSAKIP